MRIAVASTALAAVLSLAPTAAPAATLQPVQGWTIDYGLTQCTAARSFSSASGPVTLGVVPSLSGGTYKFLVSVPRSGPAYAHEAIGTLDFGSGAIVSPVLNYGRAGVPLSVYQFSLSAAAMEQARTAPAATLRSNDGTLFTFALSDMPQLLDGLRSCTGSLQSYWNMGGGTPVSAQGAPLVNVRSLFTPAEYPVEALRQQQQGAAQFQLLVDESGAVAGCNVLASSGGPAVDATGCELLAERAKFRPARDAAGHSVRSVWTTPLIAWNGEDHTFDTSCTKQSTDGRTLVTSCNQLFRGRQVPPPPIHRAPSTSAKG
jgi:TonB family protein